MTTAALTRPVPRAASPRRRLAASARWSPAERRAWSLPARVTVTEWAEANRVLTARDTNEPGPYRVERTPYLRGIMDACGDPRWDEIIFIKPAQVGASEAVRSVLGCWIDQDPGPALLVLPDEKSAKKIFSSRILPMIRRTPALARHLSPAVRDVSKYHADLLSTVIRIAWAGSAQALASDPYRYVIFDETDKYPPFAGDEADAISLGVKRTTTFGDRRKIVYTSTPTTRQGYIWQLWDACPIKMHCHVPCPLCGAWQILDASQIRRPRLHGPGGADVAGDAYDRNLHADQIGQEQSAWIECSSCNGRIDERHKARMVSRGVWAMKDAQTIDIDGRVSGDLPDSRRIAFGPPALYTPWRSWSDVCAEGLRAMGHPVKQMDYRNGILGEVYEEEVTTVRTALFTDKAAAGHAPRVAPDWAGLIIATVDTQATHFWFVIRAWGRGPRSRLIDYGRCDTFEDVKRICLDSSWPVQAAPGQTASGISMSARMALIDAGGGRGGETDEALPRSRTNQVYAWCAEDPGRRLAIHGHGGTKPMGVSYQFRSHKYIPAGEYTPILVSYLRIETGDYKDILAARIRLGPGEPEAWEVHSDIRQDYRLQMASEHKVLIRHGVSHGFKWVPITSGAPNHLWDCEVYQCAAADYLHVATVPSAADMIVQRRQEDAVRRQAPEGLRTPDGRPFLITDR